MLAVPEKEATASLNASVAAVDGGDGGTSHATSKKTARQIRLMADARSVKKLGEGDGASVPKETVGGIGGSGTSG